MRRWVLVLSLCLVAASFVHADTIGNKDYGNCYPFGCAAADSVTIYQQIYDAGAFTGPMKFNAIQFEEFSSGGLSSTTYDVYFSTTNTGLGLMSDSLGDNIGADNALFGTFALGGSMPGVLTLTGNAFSYDPSMGNLLMTIYIGGSTVIPDYESAGYFLADETGADTLRAFVSTDYGTTANATGALVTSFTAVPEPTTLLLLGSGLAGLAGFLRKTMS